MATFCLSESEKRKYNELVLNMMKQLHKVCIDNGLRYTLIGGSMLGAVRHKGFIPWDDDLDIGLPRPDYEKLIRILKNNPLENCFLQCFETEPHYNQPYAKLRLNGTKYLEGFTQNLDIHQGLFIDIFPLDKINNPYGKGSLNRQVLVKVLTFAIWGKEKCYIKRKGIKKFEHIISAIIDIFPKKTIIKFQRSIVYRENKEWEYRASMFSSNYKPNKIYFLDSDFDNIIKVPFEDAQLCVVSNWDECLKRLFKNYMEYPPIEKRNSGHNVIMIEM